MKQANPLLEKLQEILPTIAANAAQAEIDRMPPEENIRLLREIKFFRAFQPKKIWWSRDFTT